MSQSTDRADIESAVSLIQLNIEKLNTKLDEGKIAEASLAASRMKAECDYLMEIVKKMVKEKHPNVEIISKPSPLNPPVYLQTR